VRPWPGSDEGRHRDADKGVQSVPDQIKCRDLVGKEFDTKQGQAGADHIPVVEQLQSGRERQKMIMRQQSKRRYGSVEVQTCRKTCGDQQARKPVSGEFHDRQHIRKTRAGERKRVATLRRPWLLKRLTLSIDS